VLVTLQALHCRRPNPEQFVDLLGSQHPVFAAGESLPVLTWTFSAMDNSLLSELNLHAACRKPFKLVLRPLFIVIPYFKHGDSQ
jgi:hypothetical protein